MKFKLLIPLFCFFIFTSCSVNNNDNTPTEVTVIQWNLINVSGGVAGVDHDFELGEIIWVFDEFSGNLNIENNNTDDSLEDGLDSGDYTFFLEEDEFLNLYVIIDGIEYGSLIVSGDTSYFTLDQNESSTTGTGADGFIYLFEKTTVTLDI